MSLELAGPVVEVGLEEILPPVKAPEIKKLRESHHAVARLVASGLRPVDIAAQTGYAPSTISVLQADAAFQELVAFYSKDRDEKIRDMEAWFKLVSTDFYQELWDRLQANPDEMSDRMLHEVAKDLMDRAGYTPVARSVAKNYNVGIAARLDLANGRP